MSARDSHPSQDDISPLPQSPRDIRLKHMQSRNADLQTELEQLETHRQSLATELSTAIANSETNTEKEEEKQRRNPHSPAQRNSPSEEEKEKEKGEEKGEGQEEIQAQLESTLAAAQAIVQKHIRLLHDYNAIKDVGQGLFGLIADGRGVRLREIHEEFGVDDSD